MRNSSKIFVWMAGLGILGGAARAGMPLTPPVLVGVEPTASPTAGPSATPTPTATATATPTTPPATGTAVSKTSASINYEYGTIQVKVTKDAGNITAVSFLKSSYTRVPNGTLAYLVNASIQANGSNFSKVSRATVTTDAYKRALEDALAKF